MARVLGILLLATVLAACSQSEGESPSESESAAAPPSASESAEATVQPSESAAASGDGQLCAEGHETCPLAAGTYTTAPFEPAFSFTVETGWTNERAYDDGGGIAKQQGGIYWASGVTAGTVDEEEVEIAAGVDGFVAFLQRFEALGMTVS